VPQVQVLLSGRDGDYVVGTDALPLALTVVLGDATAGAEGACGRHTFGVCAAARGGTRVTCK